MTSCPAVDDVRDVIRCRAIGDVPDSSPCLIASEDRPLHRLPLASALPCYRVQGEAQLLQPDYVRVVDLLHTRPPMIEICIRKDASLDYRVGYPLPAVGSPLSVCIAIWVRSAYPDGAGPVFQAGRSGYPSGRLDYPFGVVLIIRSSLVYLSI